jgi:Cu-Zn family superoxide dismutase
MKIIFILLVGLLLSACQSKTQQNEHSIQVPMSMATDTGTGPVMGTITITQTPYGLLFTPDLQGLPAGLHGFHLHENPSCAPAEKDKVMTAALAAGGHFDPKHTGQHEGPYGAGHLGDLPGLYVDAQGIAQVPVLAPRLSTLKEINHTALMIHVGGDNYSDHPHPLGGGGGRMVCGMINE